MTLSRIRNYTVLLVVSLYLLFSSGFMQLRIPPTRGGGVPVGEITLMLSLLSISLLATLSRMSAVIFMVPFALWWVMGIGSALLSVTTHGMWALRDATHVIESLFLIVGFSFAAKPKMFERFWIWLPGLLAVICVYAVGYPFEALLQSYSPVVIAGAGYKTALFFQYTSTATMLLMAAAYLLLFKVRFEEINFVAVATAVALIGFAVMLFQARTLYLQIITLSILFFVFRRQLTGKGIASVIILFLIISISTLVGLQIKGRLGQAVSIEFFINHFLAIFGIASKGLEGSASGVSERLVWWGSIIERLLANPGTLLFGLGFGFPLTNFHYYNLAIVREPHNSFMSVLGRMGLIGAFTFLWIQLSLMSVWYKAYKLCVRLKWSLGENRLLILMAYFLLVIVESFGEDAFEKPYGAIPYYFFWGVVLRFYVHLKNGVIGPGSEGK